MNRIVFEDSTDKKHLTSEHHKDTGVMLTVLIITKYMRNSFQAPARPATGLKIKTALQPTPTEHTHEMWIIQPSASLHTGDRSREG
jgi:hypothetical protein